MIGWARPELTPSKGQKTVPGHVTWSSVWFHLTPDSGLPVGCFTNVSWALQNNLANIQCQKSHLRWEFQAETFYMCTHIKFQLENFTGEISAIQKFQENILESSQNITETTPRPPRAWNPVRTLPGQGRHWNFDPPQCLGPQPEILDRYISLSCLRWLPTACHERLAYFHWPYWVTWLVTWWVTWSRSADAGRHIGKFSLWTTLLRFSRSAQISLFSNLVNCFLIIFSLVWYPKDFCADQNYPWKKASNPSNRSAIVKSFSLCLTSHH